ncbi:MAG: glycosyltransferase family 39 protein, partial [Acidobacteria bacterium]|nr:glycosyltransferase family 39 protein [Acidobacteriota bacterium]
MPKKVIKAESLISSIINSRGGMALLLFFSLILIFNDLSKPGLPSNDDCAKARRAIEMIESGDLLTPTLGDEPNFDHPPLYIALLSTGFLLFGKSAFAARFFGAVCALLTVYLIYIIGTRVSGRKAGWWAGFFLTTSFFYIKIARRVQADIPFAVFTLAALYFFIRAYEAWQESEDMGKSNAQIFKFMLLFGFFTGLSGLIKSVFIVFPLAAPFLFIIIRMQFKKGIILPYFAASALAIITAGWWYLYSYIKHGSLFVRAYGEKFLGHHIS